MKVDGITDTQKAAKFLFLITRPFGGRGETFGTVKKSSGGAKVSEIFCLKLMQYIKGLIKCWLKTEILKS